MAMPAGGEHASPPPAAAGVQSAPAASGSGPAPGLWGHGLALATGALRFLAGQRGTASPDVSALSGACRVPEPVPLPSAAQTLPPEILQQIFLDLPLSSHGACALVCRHWYACLPDYRIRQARWQEYRSLQQRQLARQLAMGSGYRQRIRPWLVQQGCRLLPLLERQYRELEWRHSLRSESGQVTGQERHRAVCFFSALAQYSLHQTQIQAAQLGLVEARVDWHPGERVRYCRFSPCSRWLAASTCDDDPSSPLLLRLYGWQDGRWQPQILIPPVRESVRTFAFSKAQPDTLISAHGADLLVWRRQGDTGHWHSAPLFRRRGYEAVIIESEPGGDLAVILQRQNLYSSCFFGRRGDHAQLLFFHLSADTVTGPVTHSYARWPKSVDWEPLSRQLALIISVQDPGSGDYSNAIHVWHKEGQSTAPEAWRCRQWELNLRHPALAVARIRYGPDARCLLTWLCNGDVCLWAMDSPVLVQNQLPPSCRRLQTYFSYLLPLRADGRQLAWADSAQRICFWNKDGNGQWLPGQTLDIDDDTDDDSLRQVLLSADGRLLVRVTSRCVDIWQPDSRGSWQRRLQRRSDSATRRACPRAWLLPAGGPLCVTTVGEEGHLRVDGPDQHGQLVRKAEFVVGTPVFSLSLSPDGLSLLLHLDTRHPRILELGSPELPAEDPL